MENLTYISPFDKLANITGLLSVVYSPLKFLQARCHFKNINKTMFPKKQIFKALIIVVFIFLMAFANLYVVRQMANCAINMYFYDRLLVAYEAGSAAKMEENLNIIASNSDLPRERGLAIKFKKNIGNIKDPHTFLKNIVANNRARLKRLKNMRNISIILIVILFILRCVILAKDWLALRQKKETLPKNF